MSCPPLRFHSQEIASLTSFGYLLAIVISAALLVPVATAAAVDAPRGLAVIDVPNGGDFQRALDQAQPGDTIRLAAGATFTGPFALPAKSPGSAIVVRTDAPDSDLPPPGVRVRAADIPRMAKLVASTGSVFSSAPRAQHYRFLGLEIAPTPGTFLYNVVTLGDGSESSVAEQPNDITFDRCYIHGDPVAGSRRGIAMNGRNLADTTKLASLSRSAAMSRSNAASSQLSSVAREPAAR